MEVNNEYQEFKNTLFEIKDIIEKKDSTNYDIRMNEFCEELVKYIYDNENDEIINTLKTEWDSIAFWESVHDKINSKISLFLQLKNIRNMPINEVHKLIELAFENKYYEHETEDYLVDNNKIKADIVQSLYQILNMCENAIIMQMISKRRFTELFQDRLRLNELSDLLWDLYFTNKDVLEKYIYYNKIATLDLKISNLIKNNENLINELEFVEYLITSQIEESQE